MADLHDLTALEQAAALRAGELSSVDLTRHYLERSERLNDAVGAFVTITPELALEQAAAADAERRTTDGSLPLLHGISVPIKDLNLYTGVRCTMGSAAYADFVAPIDDHFVIRLREAGTVMTGKTNTPEFGLTCYTENQVAPPARTPWDLERSAGGSSGGAAAAVAAGLAPIAQGSDGGGSIRIPSSVCGLVGLKTSRGRISNGPLRDAVGELPVNGPIARTVADAAALLDAMSGSFIDDIQTAPPLSAGETFLDAASRDPGPLRIGRYCISPIPGVEVDPQVLAGYEQASRMLEALGHTVEDVEPPIQPDLVDTFERIWGVLALLTPVPPDALDRLQPITLWLRERGGRTSGLEIAQAVSALRMASRTAITGTSAYDAILTPSLAQLPSMIGGLRHDADPAADFAAQKAFTPFAAAYNMTGQPAMSLPLHWTDDGLPVGMQLIGRPYDEVTLLMLAGQLERAHPWAHRHPDLW